MDKLHHVVPDRDCGVAVEVHGLRRIVARPHGAGVVRRIAAEPTILVCAGGTRLARNGHIAQTGGAAGAVSRSIVEHIGHDPCGVRRECGLDLGLVVEYDLGAVGIRDLEIGAGLVHNAVVRQSGVRLRHFSDGNAVVRLTEGHGCVVCVGVDKAREIEPVAQEIEGRRRRQLIHDLRRNGVL